MEIDMNISLTELLPEVLVFPYEQSLVDSLEQACLEYVGKIDIDKYEACILYLFLDIPSEDLIQSLNAHTGKKYPDRVYRALSGFVVGKTISTVSDDDDKLMYSLALRNVLKIKNDEISGIITKTINPSCFAIVEDYWNANISIPSLRGKDIISTIFDAETWDDAGLDTESDFADIQTLAKFYCRELFKNKYSAFELSDNQNMFVIASQIAKDIATQKWLFTAENPYGIFKRVGVKGAAISLNKIKEQISNIQNADKEDIASVSVFRRYLYLNDYEEIGSHRISPQSFGIAIFYELLYERLKSEKYE